MTRSLDDDIRGRENLAGRMRVLLAEEPSLDERSRRTSKLSPGNISRTSDSVIDGVWGWRADLVSDPYDLERFVDAQNAGDAYEHALRELRTGRKRTHWMWFVFPQVAGLGRSPMAMRYAISGLPEARAYLRHPILGPRMLEAARAVADLSGATAQEIFGATDAMKLRSSMTLFSHANPDAMPFRQILTGFFGGHEDQATTTRLTGKQ